MIHFCPSVDLAETSHEHSCSSYNSLTPVSIISVPVALSLCENPEFHEEAQASLRTQRGGGALMVDRERGMQAKLWDFKQNRPMQWGEVGRSREPWAQLYIYIYIYICSNICVRVRAPLFLMRWHSRNNKPQHVFWEFARASTCTKISRPLNTHVS